MEADRTRVLPNDEGGELRIDDYGRVRVLTWDRPKRLNAWNSQTYDETTDAIIDAAVDPSVAVLVITGAGRSFSSGGDLTMGKADSGDWDDMGQGGVGAKNIDKHGFLGLIDQLAAFPKPLLLAVNGLAVGGAASVLGLADMVYMADDARICAPFPKMGVTPEGGLTFTFLQLLGRTAASWALLSGEWVSAEDCHRVGLAWRLAPADRLLDDVLADATALAERPLAVLIETKRLLKASWKHEVADAREREYDTFRKLLTTKSAQEGLLAHQARTGVDFATLDEKYPVTTTVQVQDRVSRFRDNWTRYKPQ